MIQQAFCCLQNPCFHIAFFLPSSFYYCMIKIIFLIWVDLFLSFRRASFQKAPQGNQPLRIRYGRVRTSPHSPALQWPVLPIAKAFIALYYWKNMRYKTECRSDTVDHHNINLLLSGLTIPRWESQQFLYHLKDKDGAPQTFGSGCRRNWGMRFPSNPSTRSPRSHFLV